jgi:capsid protein
VLVRGYYDRPDQVRGISPLAPALNTLRDLYEGCDYALAKMKIAQLLGIKTTRQAEDSLVPAQPVEGGDEEGAPSPRYQIDLGRGIWMVDLDPGDDLEMVQPNVPGDAFESYTKLMISLALLALDIPYCWLDVAATNFFGARAALNLYLISAEQKRAANLRILNRWTRWQLQRAVLQGELKLPESMTVDQLQWSWTPRGMPWWNPVQESEGALRAIAGGLDSPQRVCQANGSNVFRNIDQIAEVIKYAKRRGVSLSFAPTAIIEGVTTDGEAKPENAE